MGTKMHSRLLLPSALPDKFVQVYFYVQGLSKSTFAAWCWGLSSTGSIGRSALVILKIRLDVMMAGSQGEIALLPARPALCDFYMKNITYVIKSKSISSHVLISFPDKIQRNLMNYVHHHSKQF